MKKRVFEILDEMNVEDAANGTRMVEISITFVSAQKVKAGAHIVMCAEEKCLHDILNDKKIPMLLLIDRDEYFKRDRLSTEKSEHGKED